MEYFAFQWHITEACDQWCELLRFSHGCPAVAYGYHWNMYAPNPQCWKEIRESGI